MEKGNAREKKSLKKNQKTEEATIWGGEGKNKAEKGLNRH